MLVKRDVDEFLLKMATPQEPVRLTCDGCEKGVDRAVCHRCIERYLDERQTIEDIRRM